MYTAVSSTTSDVAIVSQARLPMFFTPQAFSTILFKIYPQLFAAILAYATVGTVITTFFGRKLVGLNFLQIQKEAFFRYSLMRVRENSESIAFYGGELMVLRGGGGVNEKL